MKSSDAKETLGLNRSTLNVLASISVIGGHSALLRIGGRVETKGQEGAMRETGVIIFFDRSGGKIKVLFDHDRTRVIECDSSKLSPIDFVAVSPSSFGLTPTLVSLFEFFVTSLVTDEKESEERKHQEEKEEREEKERQKKRERGTRKASKKREARESSSS